MARTLQQVTRCSDLAWMTRRDDLSSFHGTPCLKIEPFVDTQPDFETQLSRSIEAWYLGSQRSLVMPVTLFDDRDGR